VQLEHSFSVPVGIDEAWRILLDIERIGPCMPGAAIDSVDGDDFTGTVKVKLGPINLTYKGKASFVEKDEAAHRAVIDARGRDARGNGTAAAKVTATLAGSGTSTTVRVETDLDITGKPAQFGRGVMVDVGNKLIGQFADKLAATIASGDGPVETAAAPPAEPVAASAEPVVTPARAAPAKRSARPKPARAAGSEPMPGTDSEPAEPATAEPQTAVPGTAAEPQTAAATESATAEPQTAAPEPSEPATAEPAGAEPTEPAPAFAAPGGDSPVAPETAASVNGHPGYQVHQPPGEVEPIDLLESAGPAVAKRLAPVAVALVFVFVAVRRRRQHRS
jgi:carbon monoxide dehydrogenase subunit G